MGFLYSNRIPKIELPVGWDIDFTFPVLNEDGPWPDLYPIVPPEPGPFHLTVTADDPVDCAEDNFLSKVNVEAVIRTLSEGEVLAFGGQVIQITAKDQANDDVLLARFPADVRDTFQNILLTNYEGFKCGFKQDLYFLVPTNSQTDLTITCKILSTFPEINGNDNSLICSANLLIYVIYGDTNAGLTLSTKQYNPSSDSWGNGLSAVNQNRISPAGFGVGTLIYAVGGAVGISIFSDNDEYDTVAIAWTNKLDLPVNKFVHAGATLGILGYVYAGRATFFAGSEVDTCHEYDNVANAWAAKGTLVTARSSVSGSNIGTEAFCIGGLNNVSTFVADNEKYSQSGNAWAVQLPMAVGTRFLGIATIADKLYLAGGFDGSIYLNTHQEYVVNTYTSKTPMPTPARSRLGYSGVGTKGYATHGYNGTRQDDTDEYDQAANTWTGKSDSLLDRIQFGQVAA